MRRAIPFACLLALLPLSGCGADPAPGTPLEQAQDALNRGDGLGAEVALRELLAQGAAREDLAAYLGHAELQQGELVEARRWLGEGRFSDTSAAHGFHMLGRLEMAEGNLPAAGQAFDRSHAAAPDNSDLWVDIGRLRFRGGEQAQAMDASKRAVDLDPANPEALLLRAQLVRDAEGLAAAVPWFEAGLEQAPDNLDLLGDYAATLGDLGRHTEMLTVVRQMAEIDDRNPRLFYLQAVLAARGGEFLLARTLLGRAGDGHAKTPAGMMLSGLLDIENGNFQSAAQTLDRLAAMQPDNQRVRDLLVRAISLGLNDTELTHRFDALARLPSASPYLRLAIARSHEAIDQREQAAGLLDQAALPRTGNLVAVQGHTPLSVAEMRKGQSGEAVQALLRGRIVAGQAGRAASDAEAFRKRNPGSADARALAGDARLAAKEPAAALELYRAAAEIRRTWPMVRKMVTAYRAIGAGAAAEQLLASHLAADPNNAEASAELAQALAARGDWVQAALLLDHALDHGGHRDPVLWRGRAEAALRLGDNETAFDAAVFAYALLPSSQQSTVLLAEVLKQQGQGDLAAGLERKAQRMGG